MNDRDPVPGRTPALASLVGARKAEIERRRPGGHPFTDYVENGSFDRLIERAVEIVVG